MIIGISGKMGAGKDTLASAMIKIAPQWENRKFAAKLKEMAADVLQVDIKMFESQKFKNSTLGPEWSVNKVFADSAKGRGIGGQTLTSGDQDMTVREFLQRLGKSVRDGVHEDFWVNALMSSYKPGLYTPDNWMNNTPEEPNWIITDVRYPNEAKAIKARGGIVVRIDRPANPYPTSDHDSEVSLDNWEFDMKFQNNTLGLLEQAAEIILWEVSQPKQDEPAREVS